MAYVVSSMGVKKIDKRITSPDKNAEKCQYVCLWEGKIKIEIH